LGRIIAAVARQPEWTMVLSIGRMLDPNELGKIPPNVHVFASVPQLEVLQHVDVVITHGGIATINEAIFYGVPMLVYSTGHVDQNGCAARVDFHGLGLIAHKRRETPETMVYKLQALIHDETYRRNVAAMQVVFQRYREEKPAVAIIEATLAKHSSGGG
jgi:MGT family glycosyltransferase